MRNKGFTLIETLVGTAIFLVISIAIYQVYVSLLTLSNASQLKILAVNLANEQFEIIRNLPYVDVGEVSGIPNGKIPHIQNLTRGGVQFVVTTTIRNIDLPFDGTTGGTPNDLSPADNKFAEVEVDCATCKGFSPLVLSTIVAPKNLETASTNGALYIKVFDSNGKPVEDANVHIVNSKVSPNIIIDDVTDASGNLLVVDVPPGVAAYSITVSKNGYSTDRTYPVSVGNPNPAKPDATVLLQQVTQVSFSIDKTSRLSFQSVTPLCSAIGNVGFSLTGSKLIGTNLPKYSQNLTTNGSGLYSNNSTEWDTYNVKGIDINYDLIGINPLNPISVNPDSSQDVSLIVAPKSPKTLLVTIKDSSTGLPITGASVTVTNTSGYSNSATTDRGYLSQTSWAGGAGQDSFVDKTMYSADDGNIEANTPQGEIKLKKTQSNYATSSYLESSSFDTGSSTNFYSLIWNPVDQPVATGSTSVRVQLATSDSSDASTTWVYKGPDGTANTYYTTANSVIGAMHNGERYLRYKVFFSTEDNSSTPNISDIAFTFSTACTPPGQVNFSGLSSGTYHVVVTKSGYSDFATDVPVSLDWTETIVTLTP